MIDIAIDTTSLEASIAELAHMTRKDLGEVTKQQAGILVAHVIAITPPGHAAAISDKGGIALAAKKAGEASIAADIAKIFPTTRLSPGAIDGLIAQRHQWLGPTGIKLLTHVKANSISDMKLVHAQARNPKSGRTRAMGGRFAAITRPALLKEYIKQETAKIGLLNAGWIGAATALKTAARNVPQWIKRHGRRPGGADIRDSGPMISISIFNSQTWFPGDMQRRVADAVRRREAGLIKAMEAILERRAKAAQDRMNR
jgi:hypothetical protein